MLTEEIKASAERHAAAMIEFRRDLHRHPELSMKERRTALRIAEELKKLDGLEVTEGAAGGTGVVALLRGGKGKGVTVLLRADIDALPVTEETGLPFASENAGVMHACGHDGHAAWLLGAAAILSELGENLSGCVKFVFQPGEENGSGGRRMVLEDKVLESPHVDAVFAAHAWPGVPSGNIAITERCAFGYPGRFSIKVTGRGGHGSWPHLCVDPIAVAHQIYGALQQIVSRRLPETTARVLSVCTIRSGDSFAGNIIPEWCEMTGTIRSDRSEVMEQMTCDIKNLAENIAAANGARAEVSSRWGGAVINTPEAVPFCTEAAAKIIGAENVVIDREPHLGGEDFSEYITRAPGAYLFAGIDTDETREKFCLHASNFVLDESVVPRMAAVFAQIAVDFIENGGFAPKR